MSQRDALIERMRQCQTVVDQLEGSEVFNIILSDCKRWVNELDSKWQVVDYKQLKEMRVLKLAYDHLINIKERYVTDLDAVKVALGQIDNADTEIPKDFDNDGKTEPTEGVGNYGTE